MKCLLILAALVAYTQAAAFSALPAATVLAAPAVLSTGQSVQYRAQDNVGNYNFGYDESHATGATFRRESGSLGTKVGSYGLRDADGRVRVVNYVADAAGFRADIQTNEPGVEPKDPASTTINKAALVAAPVTQFVAAAAPATPVIAESNVIATPSNSPISYALPATYALNAPATYAINAPATYAVSAPATYAVSAPATYAFSAPHAVAVSAPHSKLTYSETTVHPGKTIISSPAVHTYAAAPSLHYIHGASALAAAHTIKLH